MTFGRRTVWVMAVCAALALPVPAASQMSLGLSGGLSIASLTGDDVEDDFESRSGFNVGAFAEFPLGDILWLVPGVYYVQKGATAEPSAQLVEKISIDYLEIPLLLRVGVSTRQPVGINLLLGPTLAFQLKCELEAGTVERTCEQAATAQADLTKKFDLGLAVGGGLSFAVSPNLSLIANALWDLGLMSIDESAAERDAKNEAILLNVGFSFRPGM